METKVLNNVASETESNQGLAIITPVTFGAGISVLVSGFAIYYDTLKEIFLQTLYSPYLAFAGWVGLICGVLVFGIALTLRIINKEHDVVWARFSGIGMVVLSIAILAMSLCVKWWWTYFIAGALCLAGSIVLLIRGLKKAA